MVERDFWHAEWIHPHKGVIARLGHITGLMQTKIDERLPVCIGRTPHRLRNSSGFDPHVCLGKKQDSGIRLRSISTLVDSLIAPRSDLTMGFVDVTYVARALKLATSIIEWLSHTFRYPRRPLSQE